VTITVGSGVAAKTATLTLKTPQLTGIELSDTHRLGSGTPFPIVGGSGIRLNINLITDIGGPPGGLSISLSSSDPAVLPVPASFTIPERYHNAVVSVEPFSVSNDTPVTITARQGPNTKTAEVVVKAISPQNVSLRVQRWGTESSVVFGGAAVFVSVNLNAPAPPGGLLIPLTSSNPNVLSVPATMNFRQGITGTDIEATTSPVTQNTPVTITAGQGAGAKTASILVRPLIIESLSVSPQIVTAGTLAEASVRLNGPAPFSGFIVPLRSSNMGVASVPATITVPANQTNASFQVTTSTVSADTNVTITAGQGAGAKTVNILVRP
jgi:hypothetical protein